MRTAAGRIRDDSSLFRHRRRGGGLPGHTGAIIPPTPSLIPISRQAQAWRLIGIREGEYESPDTTHMGEGKSGLMKE